MRTEEVLNRRSIRKWPRTKLLVISFVIGTAVTLLTFWMLVTHHHSAPFNAFFAPGAIVALVIGFITHCQDPWYALTLLGANSAFYGLLVYVLLSKTWFRRHPH
jgi:O-antigen/teichoic acid export membrane protein